MCNFLLKNRNEKKNFEGGEQLKTHACGQYFKQNACLPFSKTQPNIYGPEWLEGPITQTEPKENS